MGGKKTHRIAMQDSTTSLWHLCEGLKFDPSQPPHSPKKMRDDGSWEDDNGSVVDSQWPPCWGFGRHGDITQAAQVEIPKGTYIDRYGSKYGMFFSQPSCSFEERSMLPLENKTPYTVYKVVKSFTALVGIVAPWFGKPGGGIQIMACCSAKELIASGRIKAVVRDVVRGVNTYCHVNTHDDNKRDSRHRLHSIKKALNAIRF